MGLCDIWYPGWALLPTLLVLNTGTCFIVSYFIAYGHGHIVPIWPYISDTGTTPPESCYFGQLLNISAALAIVFGVLRYWMMQSYMEQQMIQRRRHEVVNQASLIMMTLAGFGMSMVANFQELNVDQLHYTGAAMTFGLGGLYILAETYNSYTLRPVFASAAMPVLRVFLGVVSLSVITMTVVAAFLASSAWDANPPPDGNQLKWSKDDPGYYWHVVATGCEWTSGFCFLMFFVTMIPEFRCFSLGVDVQLRHELLNEDNNSDINR